LRRHKFRQLCLAHPGSTHRDQQIPKYFIHVSPCILTRSASTSESTARCCIGSACTMICIPSLNPYNLSPCYKRGSEAQDWAATSHLYHRIKAITSVRTYCTSGSITRSFPCPSGSHQPTGAEADHVEPGSVPSSLTCNRPILASTRRGFAHKIVPNGVQLWRRLCSPLGVPPDDDDDEFKHI